MNTFQFPHTRLIRFLLPLLLSAILLPSCGEIRSTDTPVPAALQIGYRRMFNHDRSELAFTPFAEAVQKSGSITLARLDNAEDTGEGYAIYTFTVLESLYNPDDDKVIHLYEGNTAGTAGSADSTPATDAAAPADMAPAMVPATVSAVLNDPIAYQKGLVYLLCLSRATDVYYPHPFFHNFNGIRIAADEKGNVVEAVSADGRDNLKKTGDFRQAFRTMDKAKALVQSLLPDETVQQKGSYRFSGREVTSDDPAVIAESSDYIAEVRTDSIVFQNRYIQEVKCTITKPYKGIFGLGSGPDPTGNATLPATSILPGHRQITVLFPADPDVSVGRKWLVFMYEDAEYRVTSRNSAIAVEPGSDYVRFMSAIETTMAVAPTPETFVPTPAAAVPTPTPTPKVYRLLNEYKDLVAKNSDIRGWIHQDGTVIDYPVMQAKDNDWYLARNIDKKKVVSGSIVLDFRVDIKNLGRNTPVYGHNMKHGSMFHSLVNYKTEKYFKDHPVIEFNTLYEKMEWEVFAVYVVDSGYNYVITMDFTDDAEFQLFLDDIRKRSIYPMPIEVTTDDKIMTMVTCSYEFDGARTIVQARLKK